MMRTLYVSDLDGTLLDRDQRVSEQTATIINELVASGMLFTVATARSTPSARRVLAGCRPQVAGRLMNGVLIVDPVTNMPLRRNVLPPDLARDLIRDHLAGGLNPFVYTLDAAGRYHAYYLGATNACERDYVDRRRAAGDDRFAVVADLAEAIDGDVLSLSTIERPDRMAALHRRLATNPLLCCHFDHDIYMPALHG
jgi:hydroxymethylpyrimidine pyrophosphatase-like HAD family hydrolase